MRGILMASMMLLGCAPDVGTTTVDAPNVDAYAELHPYLEARCATLDCHGDEGRPLRLYAETGLRMPGVDRDALITPPELEANAWSLFAVDATSPADQHLSFLKPLAESDGGMDHVGEDVFVQGSDEAACMAWWLSGAIDSDDGSCAAANERWMLPE